VGAGIFVVLGITIGYAGPAVIVSIMLAGVVASFTAFSFAEVSSAIPKEGGIYAYTYELVSPFAGFVVGCLWLFGQIVAGTAISLGFAHYFVTLVPSFSPKLVAVLVALALTLLNLVGTKESARVNNTLVALKIAILLLFILVGIPLINTRNYIPFAPGGFSGILQGAAFIFFAYLGFGRIAALGEEVENPSRTLPRSILLALATSVIIYVLTALVAVGLQNYTVLAGSGSPIADAARVTGNYAVVATVSVGALIATASVLLTNLIGLSRVSFAMARNGQLPSPIAKIDGRFGTPYVSILSAGLLMTALVLFLNLTQTVAITSFSILAAQAVLNYSAARLRSKMPNSGTFKTPMYPLIPLFGLVSSIILMFSLPQVSWIVALLVSIAATVYYLIGKHFHNIRSH
jgi:basic amino acid/polyamine antiporter, APA family